MNCKYDNFNYCYIDIVKIVKSCLPKITKAQGTLTRMKGTFFYHFERIFDK